jgi:PPOX class probable F420-dependent enzyme
MSSKMPAMGYTDMADWRAFLTTGPARPAVLSTTRADGRPHAAPIWYDVDPADGAIVFNTGVTTVKSRNLARDPRCALVVQDDRPPYAFVSINGRATLSDDLDEVRRWAARIGGRYMGAERAEEYGARNGVPGELVVRVRPDAVVAKDAVAD